MLLVDDVPYPRRYYLRKDCVYIVDSPTARPLWLPGGSPSMHATEVAMLRHMQQHHVWLTVAHKETKTCC